jgi:hypothetical protein
MGSLNGYMIAAKFQIAAVVRILMSSDTNAQDLPLLLEEEGNNDRLVENYEQKRRNGLLDRKPANHLLWGFHGLLLLVNLLLYLQNTNSKIERVTNSPGNNPIQSLVFKC